MRLVNEITKPAEEARREAQAWLTRSLAWERTLDRLRGEGSGPAGQSVETPDAAPAVPHREAA